MKRLLAYPVFAALFALAAGGTCNEQTPGGDGGDDADAGETRAASTAPGTTRDPAAVAAAADDELPEGFVFSIREGAPEAPARPTPPAPAEPLDDKAAAALLSRLPPIQSEAGDVVDFALREGSKPPPLTGETIAAPFPPPPTPDLPPAVEAGPPTVLRYQPEGPVPLAPRITVTFSHPMVPITSHDTLAKSEVPVRLTPEIEGTWRWVGTKTLFFDPVGRAPMATDYTAEVPAGVKDATGRPLEEGVKWTFHTPPPNLTGSSPGGSSVELEPILWATFDQRIDAKTLIEGVKVSAGGKPMKVRALSADEAAKLPDHLAKNKDLEGHWVAFRITEKLQPDTGVSVVFPKGTPSAEGPRKTERDQRFSFSTYGPMKLEEARCGRKDDCRPGMPFQLRFTNPVDEEHFEDAFVTVEPEIPGLKAIASWNGVTLQGMTKGKSTYKVSVTTKIRDTFGQQLDKASTHTWKVGPSEPFLTARMKPMQVLDPGAKKLRLPVYVMNMPEVDVELWRVKPTDWNAYLVWTQERRRNDKPIDPPGKRVFEQRVKTGAPAEELTEFGVDLGPALDGEFGQVVAIVRPVGIADTWRRDSMTIVTWLQVTQLGLDAFVDHEGLTAWVTDLMTGAAAEGAEVALLPGESRARSDTHGLARFDLPGSADRQVLVATRGKDVAFLPDSDSAWARSGSWVKREQRDTVRWYVFDDRALYRPDETVSVKGMLRVFEAGKKGDVAGLPAGALTELDWVVTDSRGNDIGKGKAKVSPQGSFHLQYRTPKTPNLGTATLSLHASVKGFQDVTYRHGFEIQEFRRPEFEVAASVSEGPHIVGGSATASVTASYFAGGPLPNTEVQWSVSSGPGHFSPPNHGEFVFGTWTPWWGWRGGFGGGPDGNLHNYQTLAGMTDGSGTHHLGLDFKSVSPPRAISVNAEATVFDVNRQTWSTRSTLLVHPASVYVGLKTERWFVKAAQPIELDVVVADIDGGRVEGTQVAVQIARLEWQKVKKDWKEVEVDAETCNVTSGKEPVKCRFMPKAGGRHKVVAKVRDRDGLRNETSLSIWVPGGKQPEKREVTQEEIQLIPSKKTWDVGDTAEILVQAPFSPSEGVWLVRRGGIVSEHPIRLEKDTTTLTFKIEEWMIPGVTISVHLNGSAPRESAGGAPGKDLPPRPAFASGQLSVGVPPALRTLSVVATPKDTRVEPGAETEVSVTVTDHAGKPVSEAEVTVIIVDEAVLALTGFMLKDPIGIFYGYRGDTTRTVHLRSRILLAALSELFADSGGDNVILAKQSKLMDDAEARGELGFSGSGSGGGGSGLGRMSKRAAMPASAPAAMAEPAPSVEEAPSEPAAGPIAVRTNFDALALFAPETTTGADGKVTVKVKLPDNLTRYRVMAVAAAGPKHFGTGEAAITARLPLMVRMSPPRFLNFGDRFELPIVLQNQTDKPLDVDVALRATNAVVTSGAGRKVKVPANDRVEVRIPMAADRPGTARFQAGATAKGWSDAAEVKLPVWTPATTEAFATYGEIDKGGVRQPVQLPEDVVPQFGGLEVQTSSTQLQALTEAVIYLVDYPFECSEQLASRILSIAALKDVLTAFKAEGLPAPEAILAQVERDLQRLRGMQASDGGFAFWRRDQETWPFLTVHVTHALLRAKEKGFDVPQDMIRKAQRYLKNIRSKMNREWYTEDVKRSIESYALYVRQRMNDGDPARARALVKEGGGLDKVPMDVVGWLYPVLSKAQGFEEDVAAIRKHLNNRITETAGAANFVSSFGDGAWLMLYSNRRIDGLLLEGLIDDQPKSDLIPKVVRGLLAHRKRGHWGSTQENAWVLLGLDRYFNVFENVTPDFLARAWLGDRFAGEHRFKGRTTERHDIQIPMRQLVELGGKADLTLVKEGKGRMYYRLGMRYAPKSLDLKAANHGFHVEREYLPVDDAEDVTRDAEGRWIIKAGARVKVKLTMHTDSRRYHVALVDPMPAGLESLNAELKGTQGAPPPSADVSDDDEDGPSFSRGRRWWWWGPWYEHQNLRDERAEAFTSLLWEGVYTWTYFARATTPGEFVVPPAKAEEMYAPETFGRSASDKVVVR